MLKGSSTASSLLCIFPCTDSIPARASNFGTKDFLIHLQGPKATKKKGSLDTLEQPSWGNLA